MSPTAAEPGRSSSRVIERWRLEAVEGELLYEGTEQVGDVVYRFGYYSVARNGRWWWGQCALMVRADEPQPLLRQARTEGTIVRTPNGAA